MSSMTHQNQQSVAEPTGSRTLLILPPIWDISSRPNFEQEVMSTLQAVISNPDYNKFMQAVMHQWLGFRALAMQT